jgi:hypothetical protein
MKKEKEMKKTNQIVGSVSLYGTSQVGFGYLAFTDKKVGGDGEPKSWRNATTATWRALEDIKDHVKRGLIEVHYDFTSGSKMALVDLAKRWPYFGELNWQDGIVYTISPEEILAKAEPVE